MTLILTPCHDGKLDVHYVNSLMETLRTVPDVAPLWMPGESIVQKARNELFALAYEANADNVIWIDSDEAWVASDIQKLIDDPHDFITGLVRQKNDSVTYCIRKPDEITKTVESCGMGFCKMSRTVMQELWAASEIYDTNKRSVFEVKVIAGELYSEDIAACHKWSGTIYYRDDIKVAHIGTKIYN